MGRMSMTRAVFGIIILGVLSWMEPVSADESGRAAERTLRHSDVVFMYDNPKMYEPYGCTVLGWAGGNAQRVAAAHAAGVRSYASSIGFLTEWSQVIDFSPDFLDAACRNFAGEPFVVPWLWDHKHNEQPAWWWCTNSPLYRKYLDSRLVETMQGQPDTLHIDDYRGTSGAVTWLSACFCRYCTAGFREYLAKNVAQQKLAELGIGDLATFDYRQFLIDRGVKPQEYNRRRSGLPLAAEFHDFQIKAATAFVAEYRRRAEALRGKPVGLCVNSGLTDPQSLTIARQLSYFCCEVDHRASARSVPKHPIYVYKLADGLDRPVAATASGQDWAYVNEHKLPGLVRTWIALSYAFGQNLMAPHHQWCYTEKKGTHWYDGPTEEYAWLYQFVRCNARLLDGYEAVAPVAVVYDNAARRKGGGPIEPICVALAERNMPFTVVVAGDEWLDYRLDAEQLARVKAVIVAKDLALDEPQRKAIEQVKQNGRLVVWPDEALLERLAPAPVRVEGTEPVMAVPRAKTGEPSASMVMHLLNCRYDGQQDATVPQEKVVLRLRSDMFGARRPTKATLHAPRAEPVALSLDATDEWLIITVPKLELWAMVEIDAAKP